MGGNKVVFKRRHHYIPQALSRNFSLDGNTLYLYDVKKNKISQTNPRDVFVRKDFHAVPQRDGSVDYNSIEGFVEQIESSGVNALNRYIVGATVTTNDRYWIAAFWALQYLRTPVVRQNASVFMREIVRSVIRVGETKGELPPLPDELRKHGERVSDLIDGKVLDVRIAQHATMLTFTAVPNVSKLLFNMNWTLLQSEDTNYFVLSDNPCSVYDEESQRSVLGMNLTRQNVEIGLPVSRNLTLIATWKNVPDSMKAGHSKVTEMNHRSALFGERFFVYPVKSKTVMRMLRAHCGEHPGTDVQVLPLEGEGEYIVTRNLVFATERSNRLYGRLRPVV